MEQHSAMRSTYQALSSTSSSSSSSALQQQQQHQQLLQQQQHHHQQQQQQQQQQHSTSGDSQPFARRLSDGSLAYYAQSLTFTLNKLKRIFTQEQLYHQGKQTATATGLDSGGSGGGGPDTRVAAFECLAELSKVMTILLERKNGKSALGRSKELLTSSMALVDAVKQYNYEAPYAADRQAAVLEAISKLYSAFHVSVSNYVMEDADEAAMAPALTSSTTSSSSSGAATAATAATQKQQQHLQQLQFHQQPKHPNQHHQHQQPQHKLSVPLIKSSKSSTDTSSSTTMTADGHHHHSSQSSPSPQHRRSTVDPPTSLEVVHQSQQQQPLQPEDRLLFHPEGMNIALEQAKMWAKYAKDLVAYLEKRTAIEMEYNRSVMKNATNLKASIGEESFLPFQDVYLKFSSYEAENGHLSVNNFELLNTNFIVSLNEHRLEFEKKIKKIKESWTREKKAMTECQNNFNKCRDLYTSKQSELYKLQMAYKSSSEQQSNSNSDSWAVSNSSSNTSEKLEKKRRSLEEAKQREKEAYDNVNKSMMAVNSCRAHLDKAQRELILKTKDLLGMLEMKIKECSSHYFETLKDSMTYSPSQMDRIIEETGRYEFGRSYREHANSLPVTPYTSRAPVGGGGGIVTAPTGDFESSESDTNSPLGDAVGAQQLMSTATNMQHHRQQQQQLQQLHQYQLQFQHHHQQQQQHLQQHHLHQQQHQQQQNSVKLSYDERFEHEINAITKEFKSCIDSMTTTTTTSSSTSGNHDHHHPFHRKKSRLFGLPLSSLTSGSGVPAIVRQCVEEIELNGAAINGIYRVSGVKSKVESLCASFEDAAEEDNNGGRCNLVDLSSLSPNIVANVLKHFFRELPEPLMTFHLYGEFMVLAKKFASTSAAGSEGAPGGGGGRHQHPDQHPPEVAEEIVGTFKRLLSRMSPAHYFTLRYLMRHLRRIARNAAVNNMPASNLGIIFGPTLLRRNNDPNATSSTLYDATHQGRVVELLILYANEVFSMTDDEEGEEGEEEEEEEEEEDLEEEIEHQRKFNETIEQPRRSATTSTTSHKQQQQQLSSSMLLSSSLPFEESMKKSATLSAASSHQKSPNSQNSHRLLKSATCSSIGGLPSSASSSLTSSSLTANAQQQQSMINSSSHNAGPKANIVEARRQFFTSGAFHGHPGVGGGGGVGPGGSSNVFLSKFAASRTPFGFSPTHSSILGVPATSSVSAGNSHHHQQQQQYHHQNQQQQQHYTHHQYNLLNNSYQHHHLNSMMAGGGVGGLSAGESAAGLSPFSQLAAGASGATKIKKLTSANYHQVAQQQQQQQQGGKIFPRNTELSKSSSSIYSMGNKAGGSGGGMSLITSNEDIV